MSTEALANGNALALILIRICIYQFRNHLDSLTLCNARTVTFKLVAVKNKVLVIYSVVYLCQLVVIVTRIRYYCLFVSIHYYSSVIIRC